MSAAARRIARAASLEQARNHQAIADAQADALVRAADRIASEGALHTPSAAELFASFRLLGGAA